MLDQKPGATLTLAHGYHILHFQGADKIPAKAAALPRWLSNVSLSC